MTPHEVYARMGRSWVDGGEDVWAEDVVVESPFARPGRPKRIEGRAAFREIAEAGRAALPVTFQEHNTIAVHDTTDPNTIVVEYELVATLNATGARHSARFIGVLTARDGQVVLWREYQDTATIDAALAG
jgi:ketosteroid isomerase-like protein